MFEKITPCSNFNCWTSTTFVPFICICNETKTFISKILQKSCLSLLLTSISKLHVMPWLSPFKIRCHWNVDKLSCNKVFTPLKYHSKSQAQPSPWIITSVSPLSAMKSYGVDEGPPIRPTKSLVSPHTNSIIEHKPPEYFASSPRMIESNPHKWFLFLHRRYHEWFLGGCYYQYLRIQHLTHLTLFRYLIQCKNGQYWSSTQPQRWNDVAADESLPILSFMKNQRQQHRFFVMTSAVPWTIRRVSRWTT